MVGAETKKKRKRVTLAEKTKNRWVVHIAMDLPLLMLYIWFRTLDMIMADSKAEMQQAFGVSYYDLVVRDSLYPAGKYCSVCGFPANYNCTITGMRYCSRPCLAVHEETRLKGLK
jgi:hypothetical protein